jgi:hypothetical protein
MMLRMVAGDRACPIFLEMVLDPTGSAVAM